MSDILRKALERIEKWFGEFPDTGRTWPEATASLSGVAQAQSTSDEMVPKEFNDANIRAARRFMAERDHWYGLVPRVDRIQFPFIDPAEPTLVTSTNSGGAA